MTMSDVWRPGDDLWPLECEMLRMAESGEQLGPADGEYPLAEMKAWGQERTIRAAVLRHLLVNAEWPVHAKGVRLRAVLVSGLVDLEVANVRCPLRLDNCYLDDPRGMILDRATIPLLSITACHLAGLTGDTLVVTTELNLTGSAFTSPIRLFSADITGSLTCSGVQLTGADSDGNALFAELMKVGGHAFFDKNFATAGTVKLTGANITGQLNCNGAHLSSCAKDDNGNLLDGQGTLDADGIKVGGDVFLGFGFNAATVTFRSARVEGRLQLFGARLTQDKNNRAFDATGAQIAHDLLWVPGEQVGGVVCLEDAAVGQLYDSWDHRGVNGYWPPADQGQLLLDGFTYTRIGGIYYTRGGPPPATLEQRLAWIGSEPVFSTLRERLTWIRNRSKRTRTALATQPYEQLAEVYRQSGQDREARKVAIALRRDLRRYGNLTWYRRAGNWFLDFTIRYGYQTWRAVIGLAALYLIVLGIFWQAQHRPDLIVPVPAGAVLRPVPTAARCATEYPCFNAAGYAIDTVVPLINVHQADYWRPNASAVDGQLLVYVTWAGTAFGWALATLIVAGYTGLVRNIDAP